MRPIHAGRAVSDITGHRPRSPRRDDRIWTCDPLTPRLDQDVYRRTPLCCELQELFQRTSAHLRVFVAVAVSVAVNEADTVGRRRQPVARQLGWLDGQSPRSALAIRQAMPIVGRLCSRPGSSA